MPFTFEKLELEGVVLVEPRVFPDSRGFFLESFKKSDFINNGIELDFVQDNHSVSQKDVVRGVHFQYEPKAQGKLVRVVRGAVYDVAVDLRPDSPTFKKWIGVELTEENKKMLYVPPGFGHGFASLVDDTHLLYKCTDEYSIEHDGGVMWNDPDINIDWPVENPIISEKDQVLPQLKDLIDKL